MKVAIFTCVLFTVLCLAQLGSSAVVPGAGLGDSDPETLGFTCPDGAGWACWADYHQRDEICTARGWMNWWKMDRPWYEPDCFCCKE